MNPEAEVIRCDVVIVGGGIAGVACAERLAREARRQNKLLRILLIEQHDQLGAGTSSGLEGWYHTGALYSTFDTTRFVTHCLNAFEDLYNWYRWDPAFPFREHCNLAEITRDSPRPRYDLSASAPASRWFVSEISYFMPMGAPLSSRSDERWAGTEWVRASGRAKALVGQLFYQCNWINDDFASCQTPHIGVDARVPDQVGLQAHFVDFLRSDTMQGPARLQELRVELQGLETQLENVRSSMKGNIDLMPSRDAVMNTWQILRDLVDAAGQGGVQFLTGCKLESPRVSRINGNVEMLLVRSTSDDKTLFHVLADQYVFALGFDFEEEDFLRRQLGLMVRVEKKLSVMVVASPPLCNHSFVRLDPYPQYAFNHIYHPGVNSDGYSIIADSNALPENANADDCAEVAAALITKAEHIFGAELRTRRLGWYSCSKTEFITLEDTRRDYSYRVDPRMQARLVDNRWAEQYNSEDTRKVVQDNIKKWVLSGLLENHLLVADIDADGWALDRALHFALQRRVWTSRFDERVNEAVEVFRNIQEKAVETYNRRFETLSTRKPNYLCIIPGKFSLFPTLAHNAYIEMEGRGLFMRAPELQGQPSVQQAPAQAPAVALPKAKVIIERLGKRSW
jgi:glycine/D-amino acid oxidase-like deaminating enzyme